MTSEAKPRGRRAWWWLGAAALVVLMAVASLPLWAGGPAARLAERRFAADRAGRLEVGALDLSWTGRQEARGVRLFDPAGELVAEAWLDLPSLLALARGRGLRLGAVRVTASADLVADAAGKSNLERALAPRDPGEPGREGGRRPKGDSGSGEFDLVLELDCPRLTWSDARTRALGSPFELSDLTARVVLKPGQPVLVALDGGMPAAAAGRGALHVNAELRGILDGGEPEGRVEARIGGLPSGLVDALAGLDGLLASSLGETFDLLAQADGSLKEGRVSIDVNGEAGALGFLGRLRQGALRASGPEEGLDLRCGDPGPALARYVQPSLPAGAALSARGLALSLREFDLPIPAREFDLAAFLEGVSASVGLTLERGSLTLPGLPGGPLEVSDVAFDARAEPALPLHLSLASKLLGAAPGTAPGAVDIEAELLGLAALLAGAGPAGVERGWSASFNGKARGLETARVDALLGQQGLLVDVIGATLSITFSGVWPPSEEPMRFAFDSPEAKVSFIGTIRDGALVASGEQSLDARLPLTPLFSERIVGPLVPLMIDLDKPPGAAPVGLKVTDFRLPLDGDLAGLEASVRLELGQVAFELVPGLSAVLAGFGEQAGQVASFEPFTLRIEQGVARYDALPLTIEGRDLRFRGAFDLARREFDLRADVPLALLGQGLTDELEGWRTWLEDDLAVPVEIAGTWSEPRIRLGRSFVEATFERAAEGAAKKGLLDLLRKGREDDE